MRQPQEIHRERSGNKRRIKFLSACGSAELGKVASGSATQGLWLGDRKVGSQVVGIDRSRLPGRGTVGEVRRGGRRASDRMKERVHIFRLEKRANRLPCLSLGFGDDRRGMLGSRDVSLTILIASVSGSEGITYFTNRFFHFSVPPGFRLKKALVRASAIKLNCNIFFYCKQLLTPFLRLSLFEKMKKSAVTRCDISTSKRKNFCKVFS